MQYVLPVIFMFSLAGATFIVKERRAQGPQETISEAIAEPRAYSPANDREAWAVDFLKELGNDKPSADTITMVVEWTLAEDAGDGAFNRNNPLNTTQPGFAETQTINSDGVKGYESRAAGLDAAVHTITNGLYGDVVSALQANDADAAKRALWASPWAGSHYGYGSGWPHYQTEETQATPSSKVTVTDPVDIYSRFDSRDCGYWGFQANCQHWGTDFLGAEGTPVRAPFDLTVIALGEYGPGPTMGQYVQGVFSDGYVFYAGHLEGRREMGVGETLPAGTVLGFTNALAHSHIQLAPPGNVGPCAQDGTCVNFEEYWRTHE